MQRHVGPLIASGPEGAPAAPEFVSLGDVLIFIRQHLPAILLMLVAGLLVAVAYVATAQPIFTARAEIIIDPKMTQLARQQMGNISFSLDNAQVESQIAVLRSEKIAQTVVTKLKLADDPEFQKASSLFARFQEQLGRLIGRNPQGVDDVLTRLQDQLGALFKGPQQDAGEFDSNSNRTAIAIFGDGLEVRRIGLSYAIEILYSSRDPDKAALIANTITDAYVRDQLDTKALAARQGSGWLEERIDQLRGQMNAAAQNVQRYKATHDYRIMRGGGGGASGPAEAAPSEPEASLEELESTAATYRRIYESYLIGHPSEPVMRAFNSRPPP